jgi:4,5-dihydroxyphthalate decarboxylase
MTAAVWQRGILAEHHGVPVDSVHYLTGGIEQPGRAEKIELDLPSSIKVTPIGPEATLSAMLAAGDLDAIYCAGRPAGFGELRQLGRLFEDFAAAERDYYRRTGIFPIMHTVVIRRQVYERHRWIARSLTKAFTESLQLAYTDLAQRNALKIMLPWLEQHLADTLDALGTGYWDYGLEANRHVLETFARYSRDQGLSSRTRTAEEIVLAAAADSYVL